MLDFLLQSPPKKRAYCADHAEEQQEEMGSVRVDKEESDQLFACWNLMENIYLDSDGNAIQNAESIQYLKNALRIINREQLFGKDRPNAQMETVSSNWFQKEGQTEQEIFNAAISQMQQNFYFIKHPKFGIGVCANKDFEENEFIGLYSGCVSISKSKSKNEASQERKSNPYSISFIKQEAILSVHVNVKKLIDHKFLPVGTEASLKTKWNIVVDAIEQGNISRFFNHESDYKNARFRIVWNQFRSVMEIGIYANERIMTGEQIFVGYEEPSLHGLGNRHKPFRDRVSPIKWNIVNERPSDLSH